jgi:hypothetical protein
MSFTLPTFNLTVNIFTAATPLVLRVVTVGNLAWGRRVNVASTGGTDAIGVPLVTMSLLLPPGTDIRGPLAPGFADRVEVPAGTGRFYEVAFVDDIGKGFPNEHRCAVLEQTSPQPIPLP